jgi:hypothetical protein
MLDMFLDFTNSELQDLRLNCLKYKNHTAFRNCVLTFLIMQR